MLRLILATGLLALSVLGARAETGAELFEQAQVEADNAVRATLLEQAAARVDAGDDIRGGIPASALRSEAAIWREGVRKAGAFLLFWGDGGRFIAGQYWLAPDVRVMFYPIAASQPRSRSTIFVDRGFLPRRIIHQNKQTDWSYEPAFAMPMIYRIGEGRPLKITAKHDDGMGARSEKGGDAQLVLNQRNERTLSLHPLQVFRFTLNNGFGEDAEALRRLFINSTDFELEGRAVYLPQWDATLEENAFEKIVAVTEGDALNSAVFNLFAMHHVEPTKLASCFARAPREKLQADAARYRQDHDDKAAELFRTGNPAFANFWNNGQAVRDYQTGLLELVIPCLPN